jgi:ABC-2 type transport system ATP-binding protein
MIRFKSLTKHYSATVALDGLSLEVPDGAVFGLLGPNGAGKTTLLRLVMGFIFPDAGQVDRGGLPPARIGYLPERAFYPPRSTVGDYLQTSGQMAGLKGQALHQEVDRLLSQVNLHQVASQRLGNCSRGMLQRLGLAQALLGDPPLLLLDEPALGLDPAGQRFMREQIVSLQQARKTVLLSSHHLDEVTRVCTHIAVLSAGRLVCTGPLDTILAPRAQVTIVTDPIPAELAPQLTHLASEISVSDRQVVLAGDAVSRKAEVLRLLLDGGVEIRQLSERHATLEEVYMEATAG